MIELCEHLRWKGLAGQDAVDEEELLVLYLRNDSPYSCLRTCEAWGPDDGVAAPERCGSGRACFEASRRLVRKRVG